MTNSNTQCIYPVSFWVIMQSIMRHYLEHVHESDLVVVSSQNSEDTSSSFKKDFQLLAVIDNVRHEDTTAREV